MARNDIEMRITADSRGVAAGLKPMMTSLDQAQAAAQETEAALDSIGTTPVKISVNDQAIENARAEISRLRAQIRQDLSTNVNADTKEAEKRIKDLQRSIKALDAEQPVIDVVVNTTRLDHLQTTVVGIRDAISSGRGGGLVSGLGAASRGFSAVGGSAAAAAGPVALAGAAMVVAGDAAWNLGQMAADAETQVATLDALTKGMGAETFGQLQEFAAGTPFAIDEITTATQRLVAAGVPLEDLPRMLEDLGETAAATPATIEQIATVFAQMVSKGKASYEELQQLAEQGIPVWSILADKLGLTVAEVQKLATEGKLSADAIKLLQGSLGDTYSGAMARQAATFNGEMSTLKDNISQTGQAVGAVFLPAMKDVLEILIEVTGPALDAAQALATLNTTLEERGGLGIAGILSPLAGALDLINGGLHDTEEQADDTNAALGDNFVIDALEDVQDQLAENNKLLEDAEQKARELEQAFADAVEAFKGIGTTIRARVDFIISKDDLEDEIRRITEGSKDEKPVQLPAELRIGQVAGLTDVQQDLVGQLSDFVQLGLEEGARQAAIDPTFDAEEFYRDLRKEIRPLAIEAGIDPKNVNEFLTNVLGVPKPFEVVPELVGIPEAQAAIDAAFADRTFTVTMNQILTGPVGFGMFGDPVSGTRSPTNVEATSRPALAEERREPQRAPRVQVLLDGEEIAAHLQRNRALSAAGIGGRRNP